MEQRWSRDGTDSPQGRMNVERKEEPRLQGDHYQIGTKIGFCLEDKRSRSLERFPLVTPTDPRNLTCGPPLRRFDHKKTKKKQTAAFKP